jgi:hypothetical protein
MQPQPSAAQPPIAPWTEPAERLRALLPYAVRAPSRHNSQPWLFEIEGPEARVYVDGRRALHVADPHRRELLVACGAALENWRVAVRRFGNAASTELVASRAGGLVGRLRIEEPRAPEPHDALLFDGIARRRTNRFGFDERPLPTGMLTRLAREAAEAGGSLRVVEASARRAVADLVADADHAQWNDPRFLAELARWSRPAGTRAGEGLPGWARGLGPAAAFVDRLLLRFAGHTAPPEQRRDRQYALHTPALVALCTPGDAPVDWATAGVALERVLLHAAGSGLSASSFSAVIGDAASRERLREILGESGYPQVLFRLGYGAPVAETPRRPVDAVLRVWRAGPPRPAALVLRG